MFSCIFRTYTSDFNLITKFFICMLIIMLNLFDFLMKCVSLYFSDANVASIENILYTLHATYIEHDFYADFSFKLEKLLKEFSCDRFTVQDE